jgi:predicted phage terminase large subunit-like protein
MFKRVWFGDPIPAAPADCRCVRFWDMAATEAGTGKDPDWTCGAKVGIKAGIWYVIDMRRTQSQPMGTETLVRQTAGLDGWEVPIAMEEEGGSSGKTVTDHYAREVLVGYNFQGLRSTGSKALRAQPFCAAAEAGNMRLVSGIWNSTFLDEAEVFPFGPHDDQIDAVASAINFLSGHTADSPLILEDNKVSHAIMSRRERRATL